MKNNKLLISQNSRLLEGGKVNLKINNNMLTTTLGSGFSLKEEGRNYFSPSWGYQKKQARIRLKQARRNRNLLVLSREIYQDNSWVKHYGEVSLEQGKIGGWGVVIREQSVEKLYLVSGAILLVILFFGSYLL